MKGILLTAGKGSRLYPMTKATNKALLPVYDKPLIYYPLDTLMQAGIREILIIISPGNEDAFEELLGDGSDLGLSITYKVQVEARGIADALILGKEFIGSDDICLILGDNIFYHPKIKEMLQITEKEMDGAVVFGYWVEDPRPFGVAEFDEWGRVVSIEEKPQNPKSNYIIPGLYFYDNQAIEIAQNLKPSQRGELEITDVNAEYLQRGQLRIIPMEKDVLWFDAGNADRLFRASEAIRRLQQDGRYIGCIEETAYENGYISLDHIHSLGERIVMTEYGQYLKELK
ncbi:glucose-1-phosphate thymidylyltransferase RfbA [Ihubacter massiliensis]|uniref:Glucose-1-phosphate thymidylyltransferase n=1 Tax=Hominibacterium faecale TaxID=2839743 RepID=A0A9J6QUS2_9FIRM|nr:MULTISPECIES: glucose-1-phosphate thymidylyltransferase RfbA [Eubacteriales Family XIII. Incertae Sedis]MCC2864724.1 glucose-1-phosphate thymidylyltransferase RfbA [Anaerovorax odorimutans]MCO7123762.1 glucose-1-phosphate thymidylyltransferase RfbA [Ihubacter massiliensis]MCU7378687.1 glucose-1-phosphate thymidylyltransferase RfbA [Hominibacterium faecale]